MQRYSAWLNAVAVAVVDEARLKAQLHRQPQSIAIVVAGVPTRTASA